MQCVLAGHINIMIQFSTVESQCLWLRLSQTLEW